MQFWWIPLQKRVNFFDLWFIDNKRTWSLFSFIIILTMRTDHWADCSRKVNSRQHTLQLLLCNHLIIKSFNLIKSDSGVTGADPGGAPAPPKIGKDMIFWRKIVFSHEIPQQFVCLPPLGAIFLSAPPNLKSWIRPCVINQLNINNY
jgi:hypothetical protein